MGKVSIMKFRPVRVQLNSKLLKSTWHCHDGGGDSHESTAGSLGIHINKA